MAKAYISVDGNNWMAMEKTVEEYLATFEGQDVEITTDERNITTVKVNVEHVGELVFTVMPAKA